MNRSGGWVWGRRLLVAVVSLSVSWTPWALVWGDAFRDATQAGEAIGTQTRTTATVPNASGGAVQFPANAGGPIAIQTLFPGSNAGNSAAFGAYFGNHGATVKAGQNAQRDLLQNQSSAGDAYRALRDGVDRPHLDISSQATWQPTDALANNLGNITRTFADCSLHNQFTQGSRTLHVPDYRICERVPTPPPDINCTATTSGQMLYRCPPYPLRSAYPPLRAVERACPGLQMVHGESGHGPLSSCRALQSPHAAHPAPCKAAAAARQCR